MSPLEILGERRRRHESTRGECHFVGCSAPTTGNKPYCLDHIEEIPYVKRLLAEVARRERDTLRASARNEIDVDGPSASEILHQLEVHGPLTAGRLAREVELQPNELARFLPALERRGWIAVDVVRDERGKRHRTVRRVPA
jgi:hypothetical protein